MLALDATGEIDRLQWEALAERHGRKLAPVTVTAIGEKPASADHYQTERLRTGRLWARKGRRVAFLADAPGAMRNALLRAAGPTPCALGVLTHKPAADALRWGRDLAADPDAAPPDGAAFELDDCHARAVAELAAGLVDRGWKLEIGHYGRDDRASNDFERVDVLALLGVPRPDWGAAAEDARVMSTPGRTIDPEKLAEARTKASLVQGIARGRHLRRGPENRVRLFFAGDCEAPTGAELPGVVWTVEAADRSHAPAFEALDAAAAVAELADRAGCLDVGAARAALQAHGVGWRLAERLCREEAARRGWVARREGSAGRKVYGAVHGEKRSDFGSVHHSWCEVSPPGPAPDGSAPVVRSDEWLTAPESLGKRPCTTSAETSPPNGCDRAPPWWAMPPELADVPPLAEYDGPPLDVDCDPPPWELAG